MTEEITKLTYDIWYILSEDNFPIIERRYSYPANIVPLIPAVGDLFEHSKVGYKVRRVSHLIWKNNDGSHTHQVGISAKVEVK